MPDVVMVLHLEDNPADAELVEQALTLDGLAPRTTLVTDREAFVNALATAAFDVILSDYHGPGFDGMSALSDARRLSPETPFLMITGTLGEETAVEILKKGATDFVLKDRMNRIPQAVRRALREAEHRQSRKAAEQALLRSERVLRQVIDLVPHFIFVKDAGGRFLLANQALAEGYGTTVEELLGKTDADFARSPEEARHSREDDLRVIETGQPRLIPRETVTDPKGNVRVLETLKIPFQPEGLGEPAVMGIAIDITEKERAQRQLQEQAALLQMAPDAIVVRDDADRVRFWNAAAERIYGWTASEAIGRVASEMQGPSPDRLGEAKQALAQRDEWSGELQMTRRDGRTVVVDSRWALLRDPTGRPSGSLTIDSDATERKALEAQLLRAQRLESIGTLAGGIAHDLNNVLSPILMSVDLIRRRTQDERIRKVLAGVETSVKRGSDLVRQVLTFARGAGGERKVLRLEPVLLELEAIVRQTFPRTVQLTLRVGPGLWPVMADATQLHQVLLNLCVNARDAMLHGGHLEVVAVNVTVDETYVRMHPEARPGPCVALTVRDSGTGMPPALQERIFEPFFTTKEADKGTGLGLSTALGIVRSHGGFLSVYSEVGKGTTFKVHLPAALEAGGEPPSEARAAPPLGHGATVLVVEDEAALREVAKETLESYDYDVLTAADGAEAVALFASRSRPIGAVVTDMAMPVMDGLMTIRALRRIEPTLPIIVTSGHEVHLPADPDSPPTIVLPKPYSALELLECLASVLPARGPRTGS